MERKEERIFPPLVAKISLNYEARKGFFLRKENMLEINICLWLLERMRKRPSRRRLGWGMERKGVLYWLQLREFAEILFGDKSPLSRIPFSAKSQAAGQAN